MCYVYAIYNDQVDKVYIGQTMDIDQRLLEHNSHEYKSSFTSRFDGKWRLVYKEMCQNRHEALLREKQLKSFRGRQFIKGKIVPP